MRDNCAINKTITHASKDGDDEIILACNYSRVRFREIIRGS